MHLTQVGQWKLDICFCCRYSTCAVATPNRATITHPPIRLAPAEDPQYTHMRRYNITYLSVPTASRYDSLEKLEEVDRLVVDDEVSLMNLFENLDATLQADLLKLRPEELSVDLFDRRVGDCQYLRRGFSRGRVK